MTPLDEALRLEALAEGRFRGHTHPGYANMVGPFGGITAAQALAAVMQHPARIGEPLTLTVNYCAAMADGGFDAIAQAVKTNRTTQHWWVELRQDGRTVTSATAVTALRRQVWQRVEHQMPVVPAPETLARAPSLRFVEWPRRYEMRVIDDPLPLVDDDTEHPSSRGRMWVRDDPPRPLDACALAAICDVFFPRIWRRRARKTPAGTVSMTVCFHADAALLAATGSSPLLAQAQAQAFRCGFFDQAVQVWNREGELLATSQQVVYHKA